MGVYKIERTFPTQMGEATATIHNSKNAHIGSDLLVFRDREWNFGGHVKLEGGEWVWDMKYRPSIRDQKGNPAPPTFEAKILDAVMVGWYRVVEGDPEVLRDAEIRRIDQEILSVNAKITKLEAELNDAKALKASLETELLRVSR